MSLVPGSILVRPAMTIAGLSIRTSFAKAQQDIPQLWGRVMGANLPASVPGATSAALVGAYTEYSSDYRGEYTLVIGVPVAAPIAPPSELVSLHIPEGRYAHFPVGAPTSEAIGAVWRLIWQEWPERDKRAYAVDFELYEPGLLGPAVEIFVGVR